MKRNTSSHLATLAIMTTLGLVLAFVSLWFGVRPLPTSTVWQALVAFDPSNTEHMIVHELRLPRAMAALIGGGALGMAGALMQSLSRNPLADPGLLGVNGGAALGVVISIWVLGATAQSQLVFPALAGAGLAATLVLLLGGAVRPRGPDPTRLILAGAAVGALFLALTWAILILSRESLDTYRFWVLGGFTGITKSDLVALLPLFAVSLPMGLAAAFLLAPLILGDDTARALGVRVGFVRVFSTVAIVALCGLTVSMAGPIAFIGLVVPHLVRPLLGADLRLVAIGSFLTGAALAVLADILGRLILPGQEIEAGATMALIGGPSLILLVRFRREVAL
ncbi:iron complex transport system permease protein [Aliiroseovarius halocynthiae]|uniref:Iron ABC transporter permease n=1 Tax=Aliiroseovarius halocynthiae TaxID=985055 RepID=A0A545SLB5_9RHOB|nr:iron ABC transporter permease [Aliiroseovarius halocynthiae]TQV65773.1 iron ABC transporter permease [Aliiroseovarius halocynthiae]SMR83539.1 iron complex transport system permease protein [Aliiroseovarius halocynthiae]